MKNPIVVFAGALFFGALSLPLPIRAGISAGPVRADINADYSDLIQAESGIQKADEEMDNSRKKMERNVLSQYERDSLKDIIMRDHDIIAAYRAEALEDIQFLSIRPGALTRAQRDTVDEAEIEMKD